MPEVHIYPIQVLSTEPIPHDVLLEHIAVALRDFRFAGKISVTMHPFDNPSNVVFDDIQLEPYTGPTGTHAEGGFYPPAPVTDPKVHVGAPADPYPLTTRVIDALKGRKRG